MCLGANAQALMVNGEAQVTDCQFINNSHKHVTRACAIELEEGQLVCDSCRFGSAQEGGLPQHLCVTGGTALLLRNTTFQYNFTELVPGVRTFGFEAGGDLSTMLAKCDSGNAAGLKRCPDKRPVCKDRDNVGPSWGVDCGLHETCPAGAELQSGDTLCVPCKVPLWTRWAGLLDAPTRRKCVCTCSCPSSGPQHSTHKIQRTFVTSLSGYSRISRISHGGLRAWHKSFTCGLKLRRSSLPLLSHLCSMQAMPGKRARERSQDRMRPLRQRLFRSPGRVQEAERRWGRPVGRFRLPSAGRHPRFAARTSRVDAQRVRQ